jgi:hypothetical protein
MRSYATSEAVLMMRISWMMCRWKQLGIREPGMPGEHTVRKLGNFSLHWMKDARHRMYPMMALVEATNDHQLELRQLQDNLVNGIGRGFGS